MSLPMLLPMTHCCPADLHTDDVFCLHPNLSHPTLPHHPNSILPNPAHPGTFLDRPCPSQAKSPIEGPQLGDEDGSVGKKAQGSGKEDGSPLMFQVSWTTTTTTTTTLYYYYY